MSDTCELTLDEFNIIYEEWNRYQTAQFRTTWEQTRFIAYCTIMPNLKNKMKIEDLMRFEWDKKESYKKVIIPSTEDMERIKKRFGD